MTAPALVFGAALALCALGGCGQIPMLPSIYSSGFEFNVDHSQDTAPCPVAMPAPPAPRIGETQ